MQEGYSRAGAWYTGTAIGLLNFVILLLLLNGCVAVYLHLRPAGQDGTNVALGRIDQHKCVDLAAYTGVPAAEVDQVLDDFNHWAIGGFPYAPWVGYGVHPFSGRLLHVRAVDVDTCERAVPVGPSSAGKTLTVYCLGGSTCLGWNLADAWTLPAALQRALQKRVGPDVHVDVHNLGQPGYYSSQELALLIHLLKAGHRPDVVVFLDGFNDCWVTCLTGDVPGFTPRMRELVRDVQERHVTLGDYAWIPMVELALRLHRPPPAAPVLRSAADVAGTYEANVRMASAICRSYGVSPIFFWQPVSFFDNSAPAHRPRTLPSVCAPQVLGAYQAVEHFPGVIFLGHALNGFPSDQPAFIDICHYNPAFNGYLAGVMARDMQGVLKDRLQRLGVATTR